MKYSPILQVQYENIGEHSDGVDYTIFNLVQPFNCSLGKAENVCIQSFAVIWSDRKNLEVIKIIERALIDGVLAPVMILKLSISSLHVVYCSTVDDPRFFSAWCEIPWKVRHETVPVEFSNILEIHSDSSCDSDFRVDARFVCENHSLGIRPFTESMYLLDDYEEPESTLGWNDSP